MNLFPFINNNKTKLSLYKYMIINKKYIHYKL